MRFTRRHRHPSDHTKRRARPPAAPAEPLQRHHTEPGKDTLPPQGIEARVQKFAQSRLKVRRGLRGRHGRTVFTVFDIVIVSNHLPVTSCARAPGPWPLKFCGTRGSK